MTKLHISAKGGHHQVLSERFICCKSVYTNYAAAYRCRDLIIEDFELNIVYSLSVEPSDYGVGLWAVWSKLGGATPPQIAPHCPRTNPIITRLYTNRVIEKSPYYWLCKSCSWDSVIKYHTHMHISSYYLIIKVNVTPEQDMKVQMGRRGIALLFP